MMGVKLAGGVSPNNAVKQFSTCTTEKHWGRWKDGKLFNSII